MSKKDKRLCYMVIGILQIILSVFAVYLLQNILIVAIFVALLIIALGITIDFIIGEL